jgi:hypothetical protein
MVTGQITEAEFIAAHQLHRSWVAFAVNVITLISASGGLILFFTVSKQLGFMLLLGGIGGSIGELAQSRLFLPLRLRRLYAQVKGRTDLTYSWNTETLNLKSDHGSAERPWTDFHKAKESDKFFLLYFNDSLFEIVAKRWFQTPEQINEFRQNLKVVK